VGERLDGSARPYGRMVLFSNWVSYQSSLEHF
jgi:hypothetical protein